MIWTRTLNSRRFAWHAVRSTDWGSTVTFCNGRFANDDPHETTECPVIGDCCKACLAAIDEVAK